MYVSNITPEDISTLPLASFGGEIHVIDKPDESLKYAVEYLSRCKVIGFDTESRPTFSSGQARYGVSLLQLSSGGKAFLFRIKMMGLPDEICNILSDPDIVKVGAAVADDIRGLQKCKDFSARNFIDLQNLVKQYGIRDISVKKMTAIIMGIRISKSQQISNWEASVLSPEQIAYAATDAWVCEEMLYNLRNSKQEANENTIDIKSIGEMEAIAANKQQNTSVKKVSGDKKRRPSKKRKPSKKSGRTVNKREKSPLS